MPQDRLLIVLLTQVAPVVILVMVRRALWRWHKMLDLLVYGATGLLVLLQLHLLIFDAISNSLVRVSATLAVAVAGVTTAYVFRRHLTAYMVTLGVLSLIFPAYFLAVPSASGPIAVVSASAQPNPGEPPRPAKTVFAFVFDELSREILLDRSRTAIDSELFPNLSRFSRESVWFRDATANYPQTAISLHSAFTGSYAAHGPRPVTFDVASLPTPNLFSALLSEGYEVTFYSRFLLCGGEEINCLRYDQSAADVLYRFANYHIGHLLPPTLATAAARPHRFEGELLAGLGVSNLARPGQASVFHILVSHHPYVLSATGAAAPSSDSAFEFLRSDEDATTFAADVSRTRERYLAQARYLDHQFGAFLDGLKASGAWDRTTIVVTADHGTCWVPTCTGRRQIREVPLSLKHVPMMVRSPALAPAVSDFAYQHVDFLATVLDSLEIRWTNTGNGQSALGSFNVPQPRPFFP